MKLPIYLQAFHSPFKRPKLKFYFGKIAIGMPYFLPRVWVKASHKKAVDEALEELKRVKVHNGKEGNYKITERSFSELYESYLNYSFAEPLKFGFCSNELGWKTKYDYYRFEYPAKWCFVALGFQFVLTFFAENEDHYWESFLYFHYDTDKSKSWQERVEQCRKEAPQMWSSGGVKTDYYELILKNKWHN